MDMNDPGRLSELQRGPVLDLVDRVSEMLFGFAMAVMGTALVAVVISLGG